MDAPRRFRTFAAQLVLLATAAACTGAPAASPPAAASVPAATSAGAPATSATAAPSPDITFPVTLTDDEGTSVAIKSEPQKIASLTPAVTETLFRLGAGSRVAGIVQDPTPYPPESTSLPIVAKFGSVDVEKIVSLGADLVIAGGNGFNPPDAISKLRSLGIPVLVVYAADVDGVFRDIELIGDAVGRADEARDLTASMRAGFDQVAAATQTLDHPRTFYELDATKDIFGPAKGSFLESMIRIAGGDPITTGSTSAYSIPLEKLVAADPQVIVLGDAAYGTTPDQVAKRPGWGGMSAVKAKAIRPVDDVLVSRPGPRLVEGLRALALAIHPGLALPPEPSALAASAAPSPS